MTGIIGDPCQRFRAAGVKERKLMPEHLSIAPASLLLQEWKYLQSREVLRTTWEVEELIFLQSLAGRAHEGHGSFHGRRFVDTAEDDVARALRLDPGGCGRTAAR